MIRQIDKAELLNSFLDLVAEVEFGNHFDRANVSHIDLLNRNIDKHLLNGAEIFGYYEDGSDKPAGFITAAVEHLRLHAAQGECEVLQIGVFKEFRRKGCGTRLLEFNEARCIEKNVDIIFIKTYAADSAAIHFYGENGYVPVAVIPDTNGPGDEGTVVMRKRLVG